jgi:hypothetical protein
MEFDFRSLVHGDWLDAAAAAFHDDGFFVITGLGLLFIDLFRPIVAEQLRVGATEMADILAPDSPAIVLPEETRRRMSRIKTPSSLADSLIATLSPILNRISGPFQQVSNTLHGQFKGGDTTTTNYGGYRGEASYLEVHRPYLIHQDFTAGSIPTSPAGVTLWTPLNSCTDWTLRLWPGSHRYGMLCRKFPALDDPKLAAFDAHIDIEARPGTAVLFNAMLMHATSNPGPHRRLSCDIRFFPLTGFVPSIPRAITPNPMRAIYAGLERDDPDTLREPLLEALAFLGHGKVTPDVSPRSMLNWSNYITVLTTKGPEAARPHLVRYVNTDQGWEEPGAYLEALHDRPIHAPTVDAARAYLAADDATPSSEQSGSSKPDHVFKP